MKVEESAEDAGESGEVFERDIVDFIMVKKSFGAAFAAAIAAAAAAAAAAADEEVFVTIGGSASIRTLF